jgi:23S rRNA (pseudouridine1915-N3)-methyltransferase
MRLHFVWVGKTKDRRCAALIEDYLGRLRRFLAVEVSEVRDTGGTSEGDTAGLIAKEGARILAAISKEETVILLDERGESFSTTELAALLGRHQVEGTRRLAIIIGGFAGVDDAVRQRADRCLSLSRFTLTHELARVLITEQLYRAVSLLSGFPYHKP